MFLPSDFLLPRLLPLLAPGPGALHPTTAPCGRVTERVPPSCGIGGELRETPTNLPWHPQPAPLACFGECQCRGTRGSPVNVTPGALAEAFWHHRLAESENLRLGCWRGQGRRPGAKEMHSVVLCLEPCARPVLGSKHVKENKRACPPIAQRVSAPTDCTSST
uniref:Uncharacterized protein n=1 Tax=Pipistrellus kuhlii TaxID=59472 RepID=A0A7J7QSV4_PIPKU|nr:hypothetical protein mPipKuh1_008750 [Pipistrellus kuhlii]